MRFSSATAITCTVALQLVGLDRTTTSGQLRHLGLAVCVAAGGWMCCWYYEDDWMKLLIAKDASGGRGMRTAVIVCPCIRCIPCTPCLLVPRFEYICTITLRVHNPRVHAPCAYKHHMYSPYFTQNVWR
jgi:hypothetical protein